MRKLSSLLFCLCILFVSVNFAQNQNLESVETKNSDGVANEKNDLPEDEDSEIDESSSFDCELPASVSSVELSQTKIFLTCPKSDKSCSSNKIIKVETAATMSENDKYVYSVSAGKIVGEGGYIEWDLTNVKPGKYTITVGISQFFPSFGWKVYGQTKTQVITIKECPDCE